MQLNKNLDVQIFLGLFVSLAFIYINNGIEGETTIRRAIWALVVGIFILLNYENWKLVRLTSWLTLSTFLFFLLWCSLSLLTATINKGEGLIELLQYAFLIPTILAFNLAILHKEWRTHLSMAIVGLVYVCAGLFVLNIIPHLKEVDFNLSAYKFDNNTPTPLGNKNFFSELLVLLLPMIIYSFYCFKNIKKWLALGAIIICILLPILLKSLGAIMVMCFLMVSTLLACLKYAPSNKLTNLNFGPRYLKWVSLSTIILLLSMSIWLKYGNDSRVRSVFDILQNEYKPAKANDTNSVQERLFLWTNTIKLIKNHPLVGNGLANWTIVFPSIATNNTVMYNGGRQKFQHPHNEFLFIAAETGLVGLLLFFLFFIIVLVSAVRQLRNTNCLDEKLFIFCSILGMAAFLLTSCISFPLHRFYPLLICSIYVTIILRNYNSAQTSTGAYKQLFFTIAALLSIVTGIIYLLRFNAENNLSKALVAQSESNWPAMYDYASKANHLYFEHDYGATPITWYMGLAQHYQVNNQSALQYFQRAEKINPNHVQVLNDLGAAYQENNQYEEALVCYNKALTLLPNYDQTILNKSILFLVTGRIDSSYNTILTYRGLKNELSVNTLNEILYQYFKPRFANEWSKHMQNQFELARTNNLLSKWFISSQLNHTNFSVILESELQKQSLNSIK